MTVVSHAEVPLVESFGAVIGERVMRLFEEKGVRLMMNTTIKEIIGDDKNKLKEVLLSDGTFLPCDVLILGIGIKFNTKFLIGSGLPINANGSIDTDMYLESLVKDIYVGGDIANAPVLICDNKRARIAHYQLAQYHGRIAAINMIGTALQEIRAVPYFFIMLFGKAFRYSGYDAGADVVIEGDLENFKFAAYFINEQNRVVAVASCNRDPIVAQFAELQSEGRSLRRSDLQNQNEISAWTKLLKEPLTCN